MGLFSFLGLDGTARTVSKTEPLPVDIGSGVNITLPGTLEITNDQGNPIPVSGPLTDTQLRAAAVPVSGPLTDTQLRAAALLIATAASDAFGNGTREYNLGQGTRTAVATASSAAVAIGTLGASRELMLAASTRCFVRFGTSAVTAAAATDANVLALPADVMFHLRVPAGVTHFTVIRDTADGFLRTIPVA